MAVVHIHINVIDLMDELRMYDDQHVIELTKVDVNYHVKGILYIS